MSPSQAAPVIAVVGCGAIAENYHLPALVRRSEVRQRLILVDPSSERTEEMARRFDVSRTATSLDQVVGELDGAVLAVPPALHVPFTLRCVRAGVHVLCEKPLAETGAEVREIIAESEAGGVVVGVNHNRRLAGASRLVKEVLASGEIGTPRRIEYLQGESFDWPVASGANFGKAARRGVAADLGSHCLDLICWWLGEKPKLVDYADDSRGGTEAVASIRLATESCTAEVELSWLTRYANTYRIEGTAGSLHGHLFDERSITVEKGGRSEKRTAPKARINEEMLDSFVAAMEGSGPPAVSASDVLPAIEILDECYENRRALDEESWYRNAAPVEVP
jgi:predicted dehydrogenase